MNPNIYQPIAAFVIALLSVLWLHPKVVRIAHLKNITDAPDRRKLQQKPIPVLGGAVVFFGVMLSMGLTGCWYVPQDNLMLIFALLLVMLCTGTMDDICELSPRMRFVIEIMVALTVIYIAGFRIDDFQGLLGIRRVAVWVGVPLTVVTIVGIVNAINLIDGVDGLCSGYCMMSCTIFGVYFYEVGEMAMLLLAASIVGALIPFFIHNVFGKRLKMFLGDSGTLVMGLVMSLFVLKIIDHDFAGAVAAVGGSLDTVGGLEGCLGFGGLGAANGDNMAAIAASELSGVAAGIKSSSIVAAGSNFGAIPFALAVLSIPVFDTLRVMIRRMLRGTSPFLPDKTHLHHAFIARGFSHLQTTLSIISLNLSVVAIWYLLYRCSASIDLQFWGVVTAALLIDAVGERLLTKEHRF